MFQGRVVWRSFLVALFLSVLLSAGGQAPFPVTTNHPKAGVSIHRGSLKLAAVREVSPISEAEQSTALRRLAVEETPEGPSVTGLFGLYSWPLTAVPCGPTNCPFGSTKIQGCAPGGNAVRQAPCGHCTNYDCIGTQANVCCFSCSWNPGNPCSGCMDAFNCGKIKP
jgi:hypothetical protein